MSLAYSLGRAFRALTRPVRAAMPGPMPSADCMLQQAPWRAARGNSDGLHMAVAALESHTDLLQQIADQWLMWSNLWVHDPKLFRANVSYAQSIALRLERDASDVVATVHRLEALRDGVPVFDQRRRQAERLTDDAGLLGLALHERLRTVASVRGIDAAAYVTAAYQRVDRPKATWVQQCAAAITNPNRLTLNEVLA